MRKSYLLILLVGISFHLFGFKLEGNPRSWEMEDFIGFDKVGDCTSHIGDISSVFTRLENNKLFLRITFDDMYSHKSRVDYFADKNIQVRLIISTENAKLFNNIFEISKNSNNKELFTFLRTPEYNLFELQIDWLIEEPKENLLFNIEIIYNQNIVDEFSSIITPILFPTKS